MGFLTPSINKEKCRMSVRFTTCQPIILNIKENQGKLKRAINVSKNVNNQDTRLRQNQLYQGITQSVKFPASPPMQYNPNLVPIGHGFGFIVFIEEVEDW